jgi:hypothetical protein
VIFAPFGVILSSFLACFYGCFAAQMFLGTCLELWQWGRCWRWFGDYRSCLKSMLTLTFLPGAWSCLLYYGRDRMSLVVRDAILR